MKVVDFSEKKKEILKDRLMCPNCKYTEPHKHFGFPICSQALSPHLGEIVDESNVCPYFERADI